MEDINPVPVSALDIHIVRQAFRSSIAEGLVEESRWIQHATELVKDLTGHKQVDAEIIDWIIRKEQVNGQNVG
ncbi:hypothetical protein [Mesorhizobium sp. AR10]|uniref:hypothetical protein n=1 Tax=Mesorhizobium sp. AR10 TaxID=2865839 RepID=UPI00215F83F1|nr:hypothetical protein [Mesorhizobium sp. AR10]